MRRYFVLEPEIPGHLGEGTELDHSVWPPRVRRLVYEFYGWRGDELLESFPAFIVTADLGARLEVAALTGFELSDVEVTTTEDFRESLPEVTLPPFRRLEVTGIAGEADLGMTSKGQLVVSERAFDVLRAGRLNHAIVKDFDLSSAPGRDKGTVPKAPKLN